MTSSIYPIATNPFATPASGTDILQSDLEITADMVKPGGAGILRLLFSFVFAVSPATVTVLDDGSVKGELNADNSSQVVSSGYYRFDIDVEPGDLINLEADSNITAVNFIRAHLVQFGA